MTIPALLFFAVYRTTIETVLDRILAGRRTFFAFLASLALVPLALMGVCCWPG